MAFKSLDSKIIKIFIVKHKIYIKTKSAKRVLYNQQYCESDVMMV